MGRKRKPEDMEKGQQFHGENQPDTAAAVLAVHPAGAAIAVAVGPEIRVYDSRLKEVKVLRGKEEAPAGESNRQFIRSLAFDAAGAFLVAACDDKAQGMLLWDGTTWEQLQSVKVPKRLSAAALTNDGAYMLAADKFGDVQVAATKLAGQPPVAPELLLGHFCSILTSLSLSRCGRYVATTDRDAKARVSVLPPNPMAGAHHIQSYCLGHTGFVTCSAFVAQGDKELLVTGGSDGTVRLWDHLEGAPLCTLDLHQHQHHPQEQQGQEQEEAAEAQEGASDGEEGGENGGEQEAAAAVEGEGTAAGDAGAAAGEENISGVLSVAASPDGAWVGVLLEDRDKVLLLRVDWEARALRESGWHRLHVLHMPTQLAFGPGNRLWAVGGPPTEASTTAFLASVVVGPDGEIDSAAAPDLPAEALQQLEARDGSEAEALAAENEVRQQRRASRLGALRRRRKYGAEEIEGRKARRRDVRAKKAAAEQQQQ